jgi:hypothetical protein
LSHAKPADQPVTNAWEPGKSLEAVSLAFDKVFKHLALIVWAMNGDEALPFSQSDLLETLFCWHIITHSALILPYVLLDE